jgi:hypothetical protein
VRTTVNLDDDVAAAVERLRVDEGLALSEAVNRLARAGIARPRTRATYVHRSAPLGLKVDVSNVAEILDLLDEQ